VRSTLQERSQREPETSKEEAETLAIKVLRIVEWDLFKGDEEIKEYARYVFLRAGLKS
jgi:hypothetical protein